MNRQILALVMVAVVCSMGLAVAAPLHPASANSPAAPSQSAAGSLTFGNPNSTSAQVYAGQSAYESEVLGNQAFQAFLVAHGFSAADLTLAPASYGYTTDNGVLDEVTLMFQTVNGTFIAAQYYLNGTVLPIIEPTHGAINLFGSPTSPTRASSPSDETPAGVSRALQLVQQDPRFIAAENGSTYTYIDYAGIGMSYHNGTSTSGELILYFDHYSATCSGCRPTIQSQLQVYATASGIILTIQPITNQGELNNMYGGPPITIDQAEAGTGTLLCQNPS
jgi:hypothetical protein